MHVAHGKITPANENAGCSFTVIAAPLPKKKPRRARKVAAGA
jgi:hypothetical protein